MGTTGRVSVAKALSDQMIDHLRWMLLRKGSPVARENVGWEWIVGSWPQLQRKFGQRPRHGLQLQSRVVDEEEREGERKGKRKGRRKGKRQRQSWTDRLIITLRAGTPPLFQEGEQRQSAFSRA